MCVPVRARGGSAAGAGAVMCCSLPGWPRTAPTRCRCWSVHCSAHVLEGLGARRIAALLGRAERTVRGWLAQARAFARAHLQAFTVMLSALGGQDLAPRIGEQDPVTELVRVLRALGR